MDIEESRLSLPYTGIIPFPIFYEEVEFILPWCWTKGNTCYWPLVPVILMTSLNG